MCIFVHDHYLVTAPFLYSYIIIVALCVTLFYVGLFPKHFFRCLCTDILEILPHDVGSSAIDDFLSTFCYCSLKETRGQKPFLAIFSDTAISVLPYHSVVRSNFTTLKQ